MVFPAGTGTYVCYDDGSRVIDPKHVMASFKVVQGQKFDRSIPNDFKPIVSLLNEDGSNQWDGKKGGSLPRRPGRDFRAAEHKSREWKS